MGMSASQARLLTLTARLHDVEFEAQQLQSQKIALATDKDKAYQDYNNALDATKYQIMFVDLATGTNAYVDANYKTMCKYNDNLVKQFALKDNTEGKIVVDAETAEMYDQYGNDKYAFAYAMMGFGECFSNDPRVNTQGCEIGIGTAQDDYGFPCTTGTGNSLYMTGIEKEVYNAHATNDLEMKNKYEEIDKAETDADKKIALDKFREHLYVKYGAEIFEATQTLRENTDSTYTGKNDTFKDVSGEIDYYINLWDAIDEAGGCKTISEKYADGDDGEQWLKNMVEAGLITIMEFDGAKASNDWAEISPNTSIGMNYLQEVEDDELVKQAEIDYEYQLSLINDKDAEFDLKLSKLETERQSLTTEIESITTVIDDNQERTFNIFQ